MKFFILILTLGLLVDAFGYNNPNFVANRSTIVHLFEWKWTDIALECERFLGPKGFGGVQVSPVNENLVIPNRPWWERYQPVSYKLMTRSGNEQQFTDMVRRCNYAGVRIYVDVILNHMTANNGFTTGTGGSTSNYANYSYPEVPYAQSDFNTPPCIIYDPTDPVQARNCELLGLRDLNQKSEYVRTKLDEFLNKLIEIGVAGFRIDAAKHMWPSDLKILYDRLHNLNPAHGFPSGARPYIYQEILDLGNNDISRDEYTALNGSITEFRAGIKLGLTFRGLSQYRLLIDWGPNFSFVNSSHSLVFMENHDNQRGHGTGSGIVLTYKDGKAYRAALAFLLAHPYGTPRIMSSYAFTDSEAGPPSDANGNILSPEIGSDGLCNREWVCEHRWDTIYQMVGFRNIVQDAAFINWSSVGEGQIAFTRQGRGFICINMSNTNLTQERYYTPIPAGTYCDIMTGGRVGDRCAGKSVVVANSLAYFDIKPEDKERVLAIHIGAASKLL